MNPTKRNLLTILAATAALTGCGRVGSPVEPVLDRQVPAVRPSTVEVGETTGTLTELLLGNDSIAVAFDTPDPFGAEFVDGTGLVTTVTDLLGGLPLFSLGLVSGPSLSTSAEDSGAEEWAWKGNVITKTKKVKKSDGTEVYTTETTVPAGFAASGKKSGDQCRTNEKFVFRGDNPGGATTFTQVAQVVTVCQGSGRQFLLHINVHFTITPNGKSTSNVDNVKVKEQSGPT